MERIQTALHWAIMVSVSSHIFCCVLPTVISLAGLVTGLGIFSGIMPVYEHLHEIIHHTEKPLLVFSGIMLALGWSILSYSNRIDCHDTGCTHGSCSPRKKRSALILKIATALFCLNLGIFLFH